MADNRNASLSDMLRSIVVIGAIVLVIAGVGYWFQDTPETSTKPVDYVSALEDARADAAFDIYAPGSLPKGWIASTVRYQAGARGSWHLGVMTDKQEYVGLEQTSLGTQRALEKYSPKSEEKGEISIGGFTWDLRTSRHGETTLLRDEGEMTIIVTGTAGRKIVEDYAASLDAG